MRRIPSLTLGTGLGLLESQVDSIPGSRARSPRPQMSCLGLAHLRGGWQHSTREKKSVKSLKRRKITWMHSHCRRAVLRCTPSNLCPKEHSVKTLGEATRCKVLADKQHRASTRNLQDRWVASDLTDEVLQSARVSAGAVITAKRT